MTDVLAPDRLGDFQLAGLLKDRRIVVAMSGGVDSSVVAALAARSGAEVIGVTLQLYDHGAKAKRVGACCRSEEHTSELQSLMRISYAVFCLKKKNNNTHTTTQAKLTENST